MKSVCVCVDWERRVTPAAYALVHALTTELFIHRPCLLAQKTCTKERVGGIGVGTGLSIVHDVTHLLVY